MTKPISTSRLVALIVTMLLLASCRNNAVVPPPAAKPPAVSNQSQSAAALIGRRRRVLPADEEVTMTFASDGTLVYSIYSGAKTGVTNMVYEVSGNQIITDQPSHPRRETSTFSFEPGGILVIDHDGEKTRFTRER
ncbi:MAG TPA: hypothetical protein VGC61_04930 [Pyrinomonadaceae bacterium]